MNAVDVQPSTLDATLALVGAAGGTALAVPADVSQTEAVARVAKRATAGVGGIDGRSNNAGVENALAPLLDDPEDTIECVLAVNVKGVWLGSTALAPLRRGCEGRSSLPPGLPG